MSVPVASGTATRRSVFVANSVLDIVAGRREQRVHGALAVSSMSVSRGGEQLHEGMQVSLNSMSSTDTLCSLTPQVRVALVSSHCHPTACCSASLHAHPCTHYAYCNALHSVNALHRRAQPDHSASCNSIHVLGILPCLAHLEYPAEACTQGAVCIFLHLA